MAMELRQLSVTDGQDIYDMLQEIPDEENGFHNNAHGLSFEEYKDWLATRACEAVQTELFDGWKVPQRIYWFYVDGQPVGMCKLRTILTDRLLEAGGHIGYAIRPSARGLGYGVEQLRHVLKIAAQSGIHRVLITTNPDNTASQRVALRCGAVQEHRTPDHCHFWIDC